MGRSVLSAWISYESMRVQVPLGCHAETWPGLLHVARSSPRLYVPSRGLPTPSLGLQWFGVLKGGHQPSTTCKSIRTSSS